MVISSSQTQARPSRVPSWIYQAALKRAGVRYRTTAFERLLLMALTALVPLQSELAKIGQIAGVVFLVFGLAGGYLLLMRPSVIGRTCRHPLFVAGYIWVAVAFIIESLHGSTSYGYSTLLRTVFMLMGGVVIASLCGDKRALRDGMYGLMLGSLCIAVVLFLTSYGALSLATVDDFRVATRLRGRVFSDNVLDANLNQLSFSTAQGAIVALGFALAAGTLRRYYMFIAISAFCAIATFLPMSRGGVVILIIACIVVLSASGGIRIRTSITAVVFVLAMFIWVPDSVFKRLVFTTEMKKGSEQLVDHRTQAYTNLIVSLPEYILVGVGTRGYYGQWGRSHGLGRTGLLHIPGPHNCFFAVTVYWGLPALLALLALVWRTYRCLPERDKTDFLYLCLVGLATSVILRSMFMHQFYDKSFSVVLGMVAGANLWTRPQDIVRLVVRQHNLR